MRIFAVLVVCGLAIGQASAAQPQPVSSACQASLQALSAEWNAIDYPTPSKPSQSRVYGAAGHSNSGPEVTFMRDQINLAALDCDRGNDAAATYRIAAVHNLLDPPGRSQE